MKQKNIWFWLVAWLGILTDRLSKWWVITVFDLTSPPESIPIWPGIFHFTYVTNSGAAFSLFANGSGWLRWLSLGVSLGLVAYGIWGPRLGRWEQFGYGFLLAGALGNGVDRLLTGEVVDFLDFRLIRFPIFNLADVWINLGVACLLIGIWRASQPRAHP
ncbi:signal peptidase II [Thermosynechococcaceae cyanobacterium BACA0444]|uniref:Lipoprotein signal peptidase n=1 Tax=Pseudocalidococcus azoricus BACA0444 TaxID=2918990 RepID=A0AAE4FUP9_9CYAN|nr:signal peptidase II [Pseudocalidococcus azoricus]MDS3861336.1 signal peptidase II [Pseudocalidococcus azoricus BACA0444]